jgi:PAS domain S-box-containing protein
MTTKRQSKSSVFSFDIGLTNIKGVIVLFAAISLQLVSGRAMAKSPLHPNQGASFQEHTFALTLRYWQANSTELLSCRIVSDQSYALRSYFSENRAWLMRICVLQILMIACLIWFRTKRQSTESTAARDSAFQEILALIAAEQVTTPETPGAGEIQLWPTIFLHYFGFQWMSLLNLAEEGPSTPPLDLNAAKTVTPDHGEIAIENSDAANLDITVLGGRTDEIQKKFPSLMGQLSQSGSHSFLILPLRVQDELLGALVCANVYQKLPRPAKLMDQLQIIANIFANNLKRARAEEALRFSEELKASILSSFTSSVAVIDRTGKLLAVNDKWKQFNAKNGVNPDLTGPGANYLTECERAAENGDPYATQAHVGIKDVMEGKRESFEMAYPNHSPDQERWFQILVTRLTSAEGGAVVKHIDITERITAGLKLSESEHRFELMADTAPVMMWMSGLDKLCYYFNRGWLDFTGRTLEQEFGNGWVEGVHPDDMERCVQTYFSAFDARRKFTMEYRLRRADGQYRWIIDSGVPRFANDGTFLGYIGCCFDITDRKELAATRIEFAGRLIKAQEKERERIARELHDDIGQRLALVAIDVQQLDGAFPETKEAIHARVHDLWKQITDISSDAGRISHQLHSSKLQLLGLALAIRSLCADFSRQHQIAIHCTCTAVPEQMDDNISLSLFRVTQEALHNIVRHSHAKNAIVELSGQADEIHLHISDDGTGFDVDTALVGESLGLISMEERLRLVGGALTIKSEPSFGTRIDARVPIAASSHGDSVPEHPSEAAA